MNEPLVYRSDVASTIIKVPVGFVTDLASVPRLPLIYILLNDIANQAGVIHHYLYSVGTLSRVLADRVLYEAYVLTSVPAWKASAIYAGVRMIVNIIWSPPPTERSCEPCMAMAHH